jgi:hypothetical protein
LFRALSCALLSESEYADRIASMQKPCQHDAAAGKSQEFVSANGPAGGTYNLSYNGFCQLARGKGS